jgi:hypothetical protein
MYDAGCGPELYQAQGKKHGFPDLTNQLCHHCKGSYLRRYGYYERYLITPGFEGEIKIRRYYCGECKRTVSVLPSFCHPKRTYGTEAIIAFIKAFYEKVVTVCMAVMHIIASTGVECTRQLLLHYRRRIEKNINMLIMEITAVQGLGTPPVREKTRAKEKVRQLLPYIRNPLADSLKIYQRTGATYLTHHQNNTTTNNPGCEPPCP